MLPESVPVDSAALGGKAMNLKWDIEPLEIELNGEPVYIQEKEAKECLALVVENGHISHRKAPKPGEIWRHFKGALYQIDCVAEHTETGDAMVVYHRYGEEKKWVRPAGMFMSLVDREKYPMASQEYRFELIDDINEREGNNHEATGRN